MDLPIVAYAGLTCSSITVSSCELTKIRFPEDFVESVRRGFSEKAYVAGQLSSFKLTAGTQPHICEMLHSL